MESSRGLHRKRKTLERPQSKVRLKVNEMELLSKFHQCKLLLKSHNDWTFCKMTTEARLSSL